MMRLLVVACLLPLCLYALAPIPSRYPGRALGNPAAPILLEAFMDLQCPDSRAAYPIVKQLLKHFGEDKIHFIWHSFPLWMHRQASDLARSEFVVANHNPAGFWNYIEDIFTNQELFYNAAFFNHTEYDLYDLISKFTTPYGVNREILVAEMQSEKIFTQVSQAVYFGHIREVYGTPTFYINGFKSTFDETTSYSTWESYIQNLLSTS
eukprot:TRINITY_DN10866_c0_g1_i1.p1 TRINITY_DN10866_c0_g1~~TRINITY_DN10866_c0_g1_i1.p1  ORF type:complete len:208 (-),score=33.19 TRINITY_DN10866_c0_g1_i1:80-703(-)